MSNPLQAAESALITAPVNLWLNGAVESQVNIGGISYNTMSKNPFMQTLLGDVYINGGAVSKAAALMETLAPRGTQQLTEYVAITEEVDPLRPIFKSVSIASRFGQNADEAGERVAQGNVLSNTDNAARNLIRTYIPNAHTTLQPQRNAAGQAQSNADNNNLYCLIGLPDDYLELLPNQTFFATSTAVFYNTDPQSQSYNQWIITNGISDATNSPTSIASADDTNANIKSVTGSVFSRVPYSYEALVFVQFIPQDASDITARRRIGIFRRFVNYVTVAAGSQINVAKANGLQPLSELVNAGWGTDADTPNITTRTKAVTGEVLLPTIPIGTTIIRGQANDGEASEPKVSFGRMPIPQDHYCMITRYGLTQTTDVAAIVGEHQRRISMRLAETLGADNNDNAYSGLLRLAKTALANKRAFSDVMFNFKDPNETGFGSLPDGVKLDPEQAALVLSDFLLFRELQPVKLMVQEKGLQYLFGAGKLQNPTSTLLSNRANNFAGLVYNTNRIARGENGIGINGQLLNGEPFDNYKFGSYSQGLLRSVPLENTYDMPAGSFDFQRFALIMAEWLSNSGANEGYLLTDALGEAQLVDYFLTGANVYRIQLTTTIDEYTGISIREIDYAGMRMKVVVIPDLFWAVNQQDRGSYTFINFGTATTPNVMPFYVSSPLRILRNEQQNGKLVNSIGVRVETGLVCRGFKQNAFRIRRNV